MEDATPPPMEPAFSGCTVDFDIMDELLSGGGWSEAPENLQMSTPFSMSPFYSSGFSPVIGVCNSSLNLDLPKIINRDDAERSVFSMNLPSDAHIDSLGRGESITISAVGMPEYTIQSGELDPFSDSGTSWWIQQRGTPASVNERLKYALDYINESQRHGDVLVQIWLPVKRGDQNVLTTYGRPFSLDSNCQSLVNYRSVSTRYEFSTDEDSVEAMGLPGRVFLGRVPEWTPDVQYFSSLEYPRVNHAQRYNVHGTIALPIFDSGSRSCIGVLEVITTARRTNYSSDIEGICNALQAVDLRSSEIISVPRVKISKDSYQAALPEIQEVLRSVCHKHRLPLVQTWIPCIQQCKMGSRHSEENYKECVSTVDGACYVNDASMLGFHEACSEHHLFKGQGVAGKAFTTNQPCFSSDITSFSKIEYPLSHHAKLFDLHAAVAIRLRTIHTGNIDFVLEFFLPVDCRGSEEHKMMLNSLSITIQQVCQSLRVVTTKELETEASLQSNEVVFSDASFGHTDSRGRQNRNSDNCFPVQSPTGASVEGSSWVASIIDAQQKGVSTVHPLEFNTQGTGGFSISTHRGNSEMVLPAGKIFSEFKKLQRHPSNMNDLIDSFPGEASVSDAGKATEKRRTKTEKNISLQDLRPYFAGSLKDAAKSIGVCPTTLKRICRQHGITRWPSRKIKKVGHSLRKLQVVIDSVHGAEGAFKFSSLYENFTNTSEKQKKMSGSSMAVWKEKDHPEPSDIHQQQETLFTLHTSVSNSLSSSSCSQSSNSSPACSSETKQCSLEPQVVVKQETPMESGNILKRSHSQLGLHLSSKEPLVSIARSQSHEFLRENLSSRSLSPVHKKRHEMFKVKAMCGEEKVRFRLQPTWGFRDLKGEITKRFAINNFDSVDLKYLDDDAEWVLLTCEADLQECIDVYKSSHIDTIKISVHRLAEQVSRISATDQDSHGHQRHDFIG